MTKRLGRGSMPCSRWCGKVSQTAQHAQPAGARHGHMPVFRGSRRQQCRSEYWRCAKCAQVSETVCRRSAPKTSTTCTRNSKRSSGRSRSCTSQTQTCAPARSRPPGVRCPRPVPSSRSPRPSAYRSRRGSPEPMKTAGASDPPRQVLRASHARWPVCAVLKRPELGQHGLEALGVRVRVRHEPAAVPGGDMGNLPQRTPRVLPQPPRT